MKFENLQVQLADLPSASDLAYEKLHPEYRSVQLVRSIFLFIAFIIAGVVILALSGRLTSLWGWLMVLTSAFLYLLLSILLIYVGFKRKGYAVRDHDIAYKSGYIFFTQTVMPFARIQHCEISQGPFEKMFELCSLNIYTAGGSGSDLAIPGITLQEGEKLRSYILKRGEDHAG